MELPERLHFRDRLRDARAATLLDSENFISVIQVLEDLGRRLKFRHLKRGNNGGQLGHGLGSYRDCLLDLIKQNSSDFVQSSVSETKLRCLFEKINSGRNDSVHQGSFARHLADSVLEFSLLTEDALMVDQEFVENFMVKSVIFVEMWQPIRYIRHTMLKNSFSYLPFRQEKEKTWHIVSDVDLSIYLKEIEATPVGEKQLNKDLIEKSRMETLAEAIKEKTGKSALKTYKARTCDPSELRIDVLRKCEGRPILVTKNEHVLGIVTPFDLL